VKEKVNEYQRKTRQQYKNAVNNAQGHFFEGYIKAACIIYHNQGRAEIEKTPEPFRVTKKHPDGTFTGRFTAHAQPDFIGTLAGGRAICFEAKYTTTEQLKRGVLTDTQMKKLEEHEQAGAVAGVCAGIQDRFFFVPWAVWRDMKSIYGRQYVKAADIEEYRVRFTGAVMFLDYIHKERRDYDGEKAQAKINGQDNTANSIQP
jgi:penicillin-binding protein-related factor A (putative recombinase)